MTDADTSALRTKVFEALGAASVCWDADGVFMDERATEFGDALMADIKPMLDELDQLRVQVALTGVHFRCDCVPNEGPAHCHACSDSNGSPVEWRDCETVSGVRNLALEEAAHWLEVDSAGHENAGASMAEANALKVAAKCIRNGKRTNPFLATPADQKGAAS